MQDSDFPKSTIARRTGEVGVNAVSSLVNDELGWIFRRVNAEHDYGVDGYIDIVTDNGHVTGQSIAVQIKTGRSFLKTETESSFAFYGEKKHLNYYLNLGTPVLIVVYDDRRKKCFWTLFDLRSTEPTTNGWKIDILKNRLFSVATKSDLLEIVGPPKEHSSIIQENWNITQSLKEGDLIWYAVDRSDIEQKITHHIKEFIDRIYLNPTLCRKYQGRIEISISGYNEDPRELFEIDEVIEWFKVADEPFKHWFFFLKSEPPGHGLKTYLICLANPKRTKRPKAPKGPTPPKGRLWVAYDPKVMAQIFEANFLRLNKLTEELGMSDEDNKKICYGIFDLMRIPHRD